ncbi:MAG: glutamine synthetase [Spirochaetaceae bacterium]|nr:glutamine synthetase [Spirochaetaceae bacterium]
MSSIQYEITDFIAEQDIRFVRLAFCDIFGNQKNISISTAELERAFNTGISFDASAIKGFKSISDSDLLLFPLADTMQILPWRPSSGGVILFNSELRNTDKTPYINDCRRNLKNFMDMSSAKGYSFGIGSECEFYLFKLDSEGEITSKPIDNGGYLDIAPLDKGEDIRREICLTLQEMGFYTERSHHESGPGQMEVDFKYGKLLKAADNLITFKNVVKSISQRNGFYASFLPKPIKDKSGNGLHVNISLKTDKYPSGEQLNIKMVSGLLNRLREICIFSCPHVNSYERLGCFEAPNTIGWGYGSRDLAIRIPSAEGEYSRIEVRTPDSSANPYILYHLICEAVMEGIEDKSPHYDELDKNNIDSKAVESLPSSLEEALAIAKKSDFLKRILPESVLTSYFEEKEIEIASCKSASDYYKKGRVLFFEKL